MKPTDEDLVTRFIDGELAGDELAAFEARLETEPELLAAVEAAASDFDLGENIREAFAGGDVMGHDMMMAATSLAHIEIPNPDAFNSKVLGKIAGERKAGSPAPVRRKRPSSGQEGFFSILGLGWAVAGIAALALAAVLIMRPGNPGRQDPTHTVAGSLYTPDPGTNASSYYSKEAGAMVIALEGLEEIPVTQEVVGYHVRSYPSVGDLASYTFLSADGKPVLAMVTDSANRPSFFRIPRKSS